MIAHAVWLYVRFPLSFRGVEERLAERGMEVTYETVRCWVAKSGPQFAALLRKREARPGRVWHLDGMAVRIRGKQHWLWRAVDEHGATLGVLLQERRDTDAAERFFQLLLGHAGAAPERINTDKLPPHRRGPLRPFVWMASRRHDPRRPDASLREAEGPERLHTRAAGPAEAPAEVRRA